ncbi:MAG: hypothetical protein ACRBFS_14635 [Aureispira sp.]
MLQQLIDGLKSKGLYPLHPIKDIEHSCCQSQKEVIDFDAVKDAYYSQIGPPQRTPKSCDALLILPEENKIIFGEMKDMDKLINRFTAEQDFYPTVDDLSNKIRNKFRPDKKLFDSLFLLLEIAHYCALEDNFFSFLMSQDCTIQCHFIMKLTGRQLAILGTLLSSERAYYKYHKIGHIDFVTSDAFDQILDEL